MASFSTRVKKHCCARGGKGALTVAGNMANSKVLASGRLVDIAIGCANKVFSGGKLGRDEDYTKGSWGKEVLLCQQDTSSKGA